MSVVFQGAFGRRAQKRLRSELVVWLTTVDAAGRPQPRPVWFHWDGKDLLIFSRPKAGKIRQIPAQPHVAVHFNADEFGDDVVVLLGEARLVKGRVPPKRIRAYTRKYRKSIEGLETTPESFLADYRIPIVVRPTQLRGT
jgi:PPOX class probable F420-dependent enzyme